MNSPVSESIKITKVNRPQLGHLYFFELGSKLYRYLFMLALFTFSALSFIHRLLKHVFQCTFFAFSALSKNIKLHFLPFHAFLQIIKLLILSILKLKMQ